MSRSTDPCGALGRCSDCNVKLCADHGNDRHECVRGIAVHCPECAAQCDACDQVLSDGAA